MEISNQPNVGEGQWGEGIEWKMFQKMKNDSPRDTEICATSHNPEPALSFDPSAFMAIKGSVIWRRESKWEQSTVL